MHLKEIDTNIYYLPGSKSSNIYFFDFEKKALIDTGHPDEIEKNIREFNENGFDITRIDYIINTHSHGDHVGGNSYLKKINPAIKILNSIKTPQYQQIRKQINLLEGAEVTFDEYESDILIKDGDIIDLGGIELTAMEAPGHTTDSLIFYIKKNRMLFAGDLIYQKKITQCNYLQNLMESFEEIITSYNLLLKLAPAIIYTGHGSPIDDPQKNMDFCFKKIKKFLRNKELIAINTYIPVTEFYVFNNNGCTRADIEYFFLKNLTKLKSDPIIEEILAKGITEFVEKTVNLMIVLKMLSEKNGKIYLSQNINYHIT